MYEKRCRKNSDRTSRSSQRSMIHWNKLLETDDKIYDLPSSKSRKKKDLQECV